MNSTNRPPFIQFLHEVKRSQSEKKLGGVCGGLASHCEIPAWVFRALFIILTPIGVGPLLYLALWICMPEEPVTQTTTDAAADEHGAANAGWSGPAI